jgi:hypothetical protein
MVGWFSLPKQPPPIVNLNLSIQNIEKTHPIFDEVVDFETVETFRNRLKYK